MGNKNARGEFEILSPNRNGLPTLDSDKKFVYIVSAREIGEKEDGKDEVFLDQVEGGIEMKSFEQIVDILKEHVDEEKKSPSFTVVKNMPLPLLGIPMGPIRDSIESYNAWVLFEPKHTFSSIPLDHYVLDPFDVYTGYKLVSFILDDEVQRDVCVLLTLYIQSRTSYIALGATGERVAPENLRKGEKYCTNECIVAGAQFLGNIRSVEKCLRAYQYGRGRMVSNFNHNFVYYLGFRVKEPNCGKPGAGCVEGIHIWMDKPSCLKFSQTGYIEDMLTPVISSVQREPRDGDLLELAEPGSEEAYNDKISKILQKMKSMRSVNIVNPFVSDTRLRIR